MHNPHPVPRVGATRSHVFTSKPAETRSSWPSRDCQPRNRAEASTVVVLDPKTRLSVAKVPGEGPFVHPANEPTNERSASTAQPSVRSPGGTPWQHPVMRSIDRPAACDRWMRRVETDSLDGTEGVIDQYAKLVELPPGADIGSWFRRLEDRLLTYRLFPPSLMQAHICAEDDRLQEGTTNRAACRDRPADP